MKVSCKFIQIKLFPCRARPGNTLLIESFPLTYDLIGFKSRNNRHVLTVGSF